MRVRAVCGGDRGRVWPAFAVEARDESSYLRRLALRIPQHHRTHYQELHHSRGITVLHIYESVVADVKWERKAQAHERRPQEGDNKFTISSTDRQ